MGARRNPPIVWAVDGPTLVFETKPGHAGGLFRCSACRKGIEGTGLAEAFHAFQFHACGKDGRGKRRKPALKRAQQRMRVVRNDFRKSAQPTTSI